MPTVTLWQAAAKRARKGQRFLREKVYRMSQETFYNLLNQSMQESAQLVRSSLGRSSYVILREKALAQVATLPEAKQRQ